MPKLTVPGQEIGSSEGPVIVLHKNQYGDTRQKKLDEFRHVRAGVELLSTTFLNARALRRGTHLEKGVASWAQEELEILTNAAVKMWEPKDAFQDRSRKIGSSIDRIIDLEGTLRLSKGDQEYEFEGEGICEIKTDYYHQGKVRPEWVIQVHHQMLCSNLTWGVVACADQKGHLNFYPVPFDQRLADHMLACYEEFWQLVESGEDYPPIAEPDKPEAVDITEALPKTNHDFVQLCTDYIRASAEESAWKKTKSQLKEAIEFAMDALDVEHAKFPGFEVKSETKMRERKEQVGTGEFYETTSFSVKEISSE